MSKFNLAARMIAFLLKRKTALLDEYNEVADLLDLANKKTQPTQVAAKSQTTTTERPSYSSKERWTRADDKRLFALYREGVRHEDIAAAFPNRTIASTSKRISNFIVAGKLKERKNGHRRSA